MVLSESGSDFGPLKYQIIKLKFFVKTFDVRRDLIKREMYPSILRKAISPHLIYTGNILLLAAPYFYG